MDPVSLYCYTWILYGEISSIPRNYKSKFSSRGAAPHPAGLPPWTQGLAKGALPPLKPPPGGPAPWTPAIQENLIFLDMSGI
jgi:hypothetical protein